MAHVQKRNQGGKTSWRARVRLGESSLGNRARQEGVDRGDRAALTTSERAELAELRAEAKRRRMERELLRRATALAGRLRC